MAELKSEKRGLRARWKKASEEERVGLADLYEDLKRKYRDVRRVEYQYQRRKRGERRNKRFYENPYKFEKSVFEEGTSGSLDVEGEELQAHLKATYADERREELVDSAPGLKRPAEPGHQFDLGELRSWEEDAVVRKARAGSAAGQNGLSYKLFKCCPRVRRVLWRILRVLWRKKALPESWCVAEGVYIPKEKDAKEIGQFQPI